MHVLVFLYLVHFLSFSTSQFPLFFFLSIPLSLTLAIIHISFLISPSPSRLLSLPILTYVPACCCSSVRPATSGCSLSAPRHPCTCGEIKRSFYFYMVYIIDFVIAVHHNIFFVININGCDAYD